MQRKADLCGIYIHIENNIYGQCPENILYAQKGIVVWVERN